MVFELNEAYKITYIDTDKIEYDNGTDSVDEIEGNGYFLEEVSVERSVDGVPEIGKISKIYLTFESYGHMFSIPYSAVKIERLGDYMEEVLVVKENTMYKL